MGRTIPCTQHQRNQCLYKKHGWTNLENPSSHQSPQDLPAQTMNQRIDQRLQTLALSSFQSLPFPLPQFREVNGNTLQKIRIHQENLVLAKRLLQVHQLQAHYAIGEQMQNLPAPEQTYIRNTIGLSRRDVTATDRLYTLYKRNTIALMQAQFSWYDI